MFRINWKRTAETFMKRSLKSCGTSCQSCFGVCGVLAARALAASAAAAIFSARGWRGFSLEKGPSSDWKNNERLWWLVRVDKHTNPPVLRSTSSCAVRHERPLAPMTPSPEPPPQLFILLSPDRGLETGVSGKSFPASDIREEGVTEL